MEVLSEMVNKVQKQLEKWLILNILYTMRRQVGFIKTYHSSQHNPILQQEPS